MNQATLSPSDRLLELFPNLLTPATYSGEQSYLRFRLSDSQLGLLAMDRVRESLLLDAEKITPIPNMPLPCLGLMSSRDEVFPVINLSLALELQKTTQSARQYQIIVIDTQPQSNESSLLGLIIPQVQGVNRFKQVEVTDIAPESNVNIKAAVQGVLTLEEEQLWILDASQLNKLQSLQ